MIGANKVKSGAIIEVNGAPHMVENVSKHTPSARGASTLYKIRARNLLTQNKADLTCRGDDMFGEPDFQKREVQFLYEDQGNCVFMDLETYDQYEILAADLTSEMPYITDGLEGIQAYLLEDRPVGIKLPDSVVQELVECDPAIKGASATARTKPATTVTGLIIQVPEYMENGEVVRIDTSTGKFLSRA